MLIKVFAVYDSKAEAYMQPFFMQSRGAAIRAFDSTVNNPETQFYKYPTDFTLFEIGEYDELHGKLIPSKTPISCGLALEFKKQTELPLNQADMFKNPKMELINKITAAGAQ